MDPAAVQAIHSLIDDLQSAADDAAAMLIQAQDVDYQVPDLDADEQEYSRDSWDGSDAVASYPNPSDEDTDLATFRRNFLLAPSMDSDQADVKSAYKLPIRNSHGGNVNINALEAVQAAINGARGGVEGVSDDTLRSAFRLATRMRVAAGDLEDADQAPAFEASDATDRIEASTSFTCQIEAAGGNDPSSATDGLKGIIWASGQHDLWVNGDPTRVHVPEDTISDTFQRLQERMQAGEPPKIGFDHPDDDSVAAQTALGEIGVAQEFSQDSLDDGREAITMRESEFTNSKAVEAAEAGSFEGFGFSIVGNIGLETDSSGQPVKKDGALQVAATDIERIDVVPDQAVEGATNGNLPELAAASEAAAKMAASSPRQRSEGLVRTLQAAAGSIEADADANRTENMSDTDLPTDPEDLEAAKNALSEASEAVEQKDEQIEELEAQVSSLSDEAEHFRQIAASQGVNPDADDFSPQDVVDSFSEDLRAEIADLEANLPKYDTDSIEDRKEALAGKSLSELEAMAGERWREFGRSKAKRDELSVAVSATESVGGVDNATDADDSTTEAARSVMTAREIHEADAKGQDAAEYIEAEYGVEPREYSSEHELQAAISGGEN